ncbi:MAG: hypothetical protein LAT81_12845 [Oceanicaulis sp.]|nr:hypothetical protein [Oceanicaulis sp.]
MTHDLKILARTAGVTQADLLALAPANDPFALDQPARRRNAEWFAELFERYGFREGVHIRRIHYRIVSDDSGVKRPDGSPYLNTQSSWNVLVNASRDARYLNLVPAGWFVDRNAPDPFTAFSQLNISEPRVDSTGLGFAELDAEFPELPRITLDYPKYGPPVLIEIWCEKSTMNDVLGPIARKYGANLITGKGEMSEIAVRQFMSRAHDAGVPSRILYVSDFDPAGRSMPVAVARKIEYALQQSGSDLDVTLDPIMLTEEQCRKYRLPRTPIKESEMRGAKFEARFGAGATELDALEALYPGELSRVVTEAIERHIDPDHRRAFHMAVYEYQADLKRISSEVHAHYASQIAKLESKYFDLVERVENWREEASEVFNEIEERLCGVVVPYFDPPTPRECDEPPEPLFSSRRDYLTQIDAYRKWQGRRTI